MPHQGAPDIPRPNAEGMTVAIVSTHWNEKIVTQLHEHAVDAARDLGAKVDEFGSPELSSFRLWHRPARGVTTPSSP